MPFLFITEIWMVPLGNDNPIKGHVSFCSIREYAQAPSVSGRENDRVLPS